MSVKQAFGDAFNAIFGQKQVPAPAPAPVQVTNNPAQNPPIQTTQQSQQTAPNGVVPQGATEPQKEQSPLDNFAKLWETVPVDPNNKDTQSPQPIDHSKLMEAATKVDFSKVINQDDLAKIQAGGPEAAQALVQILNKQSQQVYGQSVVATSKIVEAAQAAAEKRFAERLPSVVNQHSAKAAILQDNPAFNNPAVAPIVQMITDQLVQKHPNATQAELKVLAKQYMEGAAQVFNPQKPVQTQTKSSPDAVDWESWMSTPSSNG